MYHISDYSYTLPERLVAHVPDNRRDHSRLLCLDRSSDTSLAHRQFCDLADILRPSDLLVVNNTRVVPARLYGKKASGGQVEVLIIDYQGGCENLATEGVFRCECLVKASKKPREGSMLYFSQGLVAEVCGFDNGIFVLAFSAPDSVPAVIETIGCMPLPPYIKRQEHAFTEDKKAYQTVYAKDKGAVAAPTAGLHFTEDLLQELRVKGIDIAEITLHVGYGTFVPVRVTDIRDHQIHTERFYLSEKTSETVNQAKKENRRIVAVGTTTVRTLEYCFGKYGALVPGHGACDLFIYPGYTFQAVDAMITNFHIPESTLLMLVSAFAGRDRILNAYASAIEKEYRFYSYGDAMLIT